MADRYFVDKPIEGPKVRLGGSEAHHLVHVMRAKLGDQVVLFDGSGMEFAASVERVERSQVELSIVSRQAVDRETRVMLELGVPLPKAERQRWLVEKAVELGVARLTPLVSWRASGRSG
ncbi:MAG TPA: RsmE family RNA methyltransferase, partial [Pirellulales bacterium]|nr:RsmE family RNA methyltransferase [Pirellulales bacterium]